MGDGSRESSKGELGAGVCWDDGLKAAKLSGEKGTLEVLFWYGVAGGGRGLIDFLWICGDERCSGVVLGLMACGLYNGVVVSTCAAWEIPYAP